MNIDKDGAVVEIEITNKLIRGNVQLTKVDANYPDHHLSSAEFEVYQNGELVGKMEELADGVYEMDKAADRSTVQVELHALNKTVFGSLGDSEITAAQYVIERNGCGLSCKNSHAMSFLRNILVVSLLGNGVGSGHEIVDLDFALTVGSNGLIYAVTDNGELDPIYLAVFRSLDDLRAAVADFQVNISR